MQVISNGNFRGGESMKDLTQGNMYKNFFLFSIPIVLSSLLSSAFATINSSIAGLYLGAEGLAATSAAIPLLDIIDALFFGHAYGLSVYAANLFGSKNYEKLKRTVYANVFLTLAAAAVLFLRKRRMARALIAKTYALMQLL